MVDVHWCHRFGDGLPVNPLLMVVCVTTYHREDLAGPLKTLLRFKSFFIVIKAPSKEVSILTRKSI